ncbi:MAG: acylneuraminate cytidylyltransferase, partial [Bdellovibrionales bacterium]|nr:acylneuraminate cytidylyltransferase [Bdellovibrionales bacterium]
MNKAQHNVAFIPMRGGSKSIPHKNIKSIAGKPLYAWSIQAAIDSKVFDEIFVSTDAPLIREHVENTFGSQVTVIDRPSELAQDTTSTEAVMLDFVHQFDFQTITLIQVTNPFTTARDFQHAFEKFKKENLDSLLTASTCKRFLWDHQAKPVNYNPLQRPRRQDFEGLLMENGAFYITKKTTLLSHQNRLGGNIGIFEMNEVSSFEIDEPHDWTIVEKLLQKEKITPILQNIQAIGVDVDGTLTDGGMYYSPEG